MSFPASGMTRWLHAVHQVTGDMAKNFNSPGPGLLRTWADALEIPAGEMRSAARRADAELAEAARRSAAEERRRTKPEQPKRRTRR